MNINTGQYNLHNLSKINIILGKNGCGKSTLLKKTEGYVSGRPQDWGKSSYITPERGGALIYEANVEQTYMRDANWFRNSRRTNQFGQFRQQSITQYRKLKDMVLEDLERAQLENTTPPPPTFDNYIGRINALLDNIEVRRVDAREQNANVFTIHSKQSGELIPHAEISSGEAELISLGIECLVYEKECAQDKENILFLDEPDVHLHPDLQVRLTHFLSELVEGTGFTIIIATHSTAILGALQTTENYKIGFLKSRQTDIEFKPITEPYKKILPVFGAHPLTNIFNQRPIMLVEGEDDERIWQTAIRSSQGAIKIYPCSTDTVNQMSSFELEVKRLIEAVYEGGKAYSLRDSDDTDGTIDDEPPLIRFKLGCRNAENLLLSNQVLETLSTNWNNLKTKIDEWITNNRRHPHQSVLNSFKSEGYNRKAFDIKSARNTIMGIIGSAKPWEIAVGQTIARLTWDDSIDYSVDGDIHNFLGKKLVEKVLPHTNNRN